MKYITNIVLTVIGLAVLFFLPQPAVIGFVELPESTVNGIGLVVLLVVSWLLSGLITLVPWLAFLDQFRIPLASAVALALVNAIQVATPDLYGPGVIMIINFILWVIGLFITFEKFKARGSTLLR